MERHAIGTIMRRKGAHGTVRIIRHMGERSYVTQSHLDGHTIICTHDELEPLEQVKVGYMKVELTIKQTVTVHMNDGDQFTLDDFHESMVNHLLDGQDVEHTTSDDKFEYTPAEFLCSVRELPLTVGEVIDIMQKDDVIAPAVDSLLKGEEPE